MTGQLAAVENAASTLEQILARKYPEYAFVAAVDPERAEFERGAAASVRGEQPGSVVDYPRALRDRDGAAAPDALHDHDFKKSA